MPKAAAAAVEGTALLAALPACMAANSAAGDGTSVAGERLGRPAMADGCPLEESDGRLAGPPSTGLAGMLVPAATATAAAGPALAAGTCPAASSAASAVLAGHPAGAVDDMLLPRGLALWEGGCTAAARPAWPEVSEARPGTCACWSDAAPSAAAAPWMATTATLLPGRLPLLLRCGLRLTPAAVAGSAAASSPSHSAASPARAAKLQPSPARAAPSLPQLAAAPTGCVSVGGCTTGAPCAAGEMLALPSPVGRKLSARSGAGAGASADQPKCAGASASTRGGAACTRAKTSQTVGLSAILGAG